MKKFLLLTVAATAMAMAMTALGFGAAYASPVVGLDAPITGSVSFTSLGTGGLGVVMTTLTGPETDSVLATTGSFSITSDSYSTGVPALGIFHDIGLDQSTVVISNAGSALDLLITWVSVDDGSANPHLFGIDSVTGATGAYAGLLGGKGTVDIAADAVTTLIDTLALMPKGSNEVVGLSSGEALFAAVPEPKMLMIMLMAIGTIFLLYRHRHS
jgi:hypothetical protein